MRTYTFTVSAQGEAKYFTANLTDAEFTAISADLHKCRYDVYTDRGCIVDNKSNFVDLVEWLATVKLTKKILLPSKPEYKKIKLPEFVEWDSDIECLVVNVGVSFDAHSHTTCLMEAKAILKVLVLFPTAEFYCSRARFKLPTRKFLQDDGSYKELSYQFKSKNYIIEKSVTFEQVEIEL